MKALVLEENGRVVYRDVPYPQADPDRPVLVHVSACGVCGSDIKRGFRNGAYHYPLVMGHEFSGVVEEAPLGSGYHTGDRVAVFPLIPCASCDQCLSGAFGRCTDYDYLGSRCDGGFAEYVRVPVANLVRVPDGVSDTQAALTEPCAVARHAVSRMRPQLHNGSDQARSVGRTGAVIGGGPIGNLAAQWLKSSGVGPVFVVDIQDDKLALARRMACVPIDGRDGDPVKTIMSATDGKGVDYSVEACGLPKTFLQALRVASNAGQVCFMGNIEGSFTICEEDFSSILRRELTIHGTWNSTFSMDEDAASSRDDWRRSLNEMGKSIDVVALMSHTAPLAQGPRILGEMASGSGDFCKVIFTP